MANFADCTSSCTGDWDSIEFGHQIDSCLQDEAAGLGICTESATNSSDLAECIDTWLVVDVCSNPP